MVVKARPGTFTFYRMFFMILLLAGGSLCLGLVGLEAIGWINMVSEDGAAILTACTVAGGLSVMYGVILFRIITDRRVQASDRRQAQAAIDFPDRRSGIDRREMIAREKAVTAREAALAEREASLSARNAMV